MDGLALAVVLLGPPVGLLGASHAAIAQERVAVATSPCAPSSLQLETKDISMGAVKGIKTSVWSAAPDHRWTLTTSPDGKRLAYTLHKGASKGWLALAPLGIGRNDQAKPVVDGVEGPPYEGLDIAVFSPDSRRVAYRAMRGGKTSIGVVTVGKVQAVVVVDGVEGPEFDMVGRPGFSPDGARVGYAAFRGKSSFVVLDDTVGETYDGVSGPVFSPDSQRVAYIAKRGKQLLVVNGPQVTPISADDAGDLAFSPDGRRIAYKINRGKRFFVVVDGVEGPSYDSVGILTFSADGRLAYGARQDKTKTAYLVVEGAPPRPLGADTKVGDPVFSPDGRRMAYALDQGKKERVVTDDHPGKLYDGVGQIAFSPDGRHVAYDARVGKKWHLVVDETDAPEYKEIIGQARAFEQPDLIRYFGFRGEELVRTEVRIRCAPAP